MIYTKHSARHVAALEDICLLGVLEHVNKLPGVFLVDVLGTKITLTWSYHAAQHLSPR